VLDFDRALRREAMGGAVDMRLEGDAVRVELPQGGERHDLEAAAVGEDRAGPIHHAVQPAEPRDALGAGAEHQVIGVAEDQPRTGRADGVRRHRLDGPSGADRHERGGRHLAMRGMQHARAGGAVLGFAGPAERHARVSRVASP
jgi:hypothetical protein